MGCNCGGAQRQAGSTSTATSGQSAAERPKRGPGSEGYYWTGRKKRAAQDAK